jgi:urease gamma subunit
MVNYDIPWNPARLEQRMERIHRYGQKHNPVLIMNLVAEKTREGRVMTTLLEKMESIRKELGSDKVFDVIGRLFQEVSLSLVWKTLISRWIMMGKLILATSSHATNTSSCLIFNGLSPKYPNQPYNWYLLTT